MKHLDLFWEGKKIWFDKKGYATVWTNGKSKKVHVLVWERKNGQKPKGYEIHHKSGNKSDWSLDNLELLSNSDHQRIHAGWVKDENGEWLKKPCTRCQKMKKISDFYPRKGFTPTALCKICLNIVTTERNRFNPDRRRYSREWSRRSRGNYSTEKHDLRFKSLKSL